jgi:hypothetical protein
MDDGKLCEKRRLCFTIRSPDGTACTLQYYVYCNLKVVHPHRDDVLSSAVYTLSA